MLFVAFQEVVAGIADTNRPRRAQNHYRKPAETSEPTRDHMRLTEDEVEMVAVEFHAMRVAENPKASFQPDGLKCSLFVD
jgi:acetyl-CoA acetyltransferase